MLKNNQLKKKMLEGKPVIGTWNTLASPLVTEVFALAGFDFQIIDLEHGPFVLSEIHKHVSACESTTSCTPLVRIPVNEEWLALQALDQGAHGLVVPHINSVDSAKQFVNATKYNPAGKRGFSPFTKAGGFTNLDTSVYVNRANTETINIAIIESKDGIEALDEILDIDEIDVIYFGAYDLSQEFGCPGDVRDQHLIDIIQGGVKKVNQASKYAGGFVPQNIDDVKWLLDIGMKFITYEVDSSIIHTSVRTITNWFSEEIAK